MFMERIGRLEYDDNYVDIATGCRLPCDAILDDPDRLAELSGPCVVVIPAQERGDQNGTRSSISTSRI